MRGPARSKESQSNPFQARVMPCSANELRCRRAKTIDLIQSVRVVLHACLLCAPDVLDKPCDFASAAGAVSAKNEVPSRDRAAAKVH